MARIGILGGSFNPVHVGHVRLAVETRERLGLDRVDLVPCATPPHKPGRDLLGFDLRARLLELALAGVAGLAVNGLESRRPGPSYTCDTLAEYGREHAATDIHFILGAGDLPALPDWRNGTTLPSLANLVVAPRDATDLDTVGRFMAGSLLGRAVAVAHPGPGATAAWEFEGGTRLLYLPLPRLEVSASAIRAAWLEGRETAGLLHPDVARELDRVRRKVEPVWRAE